MSDEDRLQRMEGKMDTLVAAMSDIKVLHEQLLNLTKEQAELDVLVKRLDREVRDIEQKITVLRHQIGEHNRRLGTLKWWVSIAFLSCLAVLTGVNLL